MKCSNEQFISNLIEINKRARVEPEIIDLIAAYARLCLRYDKELEFYDENPTLKTNKITVKKFVDRNQHFDRRSLSFMVSYAEMMREKGLPFIFNVPHLANFLGIEDDELQRFVKKKDNHYHRFYIAKSNGGRRLISAPTDDLKSVQRNILRNILERVPIHSSANGFRRERSILTNAENHVGQEIVIKIDIKDFFPSITFERVKGVYINLGYPERVADALTRLSELLYKKGKKSLFLLKI